MDSYIMTETEDFLAELIWEREPIRSGDLVKLASQRLGWKKSTTYTVLRKICENNIFQNKGAVVTSKISKKEYECMGRKKEQQLEERHEDSPPDRKKQNEKDIEELVTLIEEDKD